MVTYEINHTAQPARPRRHLRSLVSVAALGVVLTIIAVLEVRRYQDIGFRKDFVGVAEDRAQLVELALTDRLATIEGVRLLENASIYVDRDEFSVFVEPYVKRFPSIRRLAWIPIVADADRAQYESAARRDGLDGFEIVEGNAAGERVRAPERPTYMPAYYVEPYLGNKYVLGLDLGADETIASLLNEACETGRSVTFVSGPEGDALDPVPHWEVFTPVYDSVGVTYTAQGRREGLRGYVSAAIDLGQTVEEGMRLLEKSDTNVQLWDTVGEERRLLYSHMADDADSSKEGNGELAYERALNTGDHEWIVRCTPGAKFLASYTPCAWRGVMLGGLLLTTALTLYMRRHLTRASRVEKLVVERTAALTEANEGFEREIAERKRAEAELLNTQKRLVEAAHRAGMADVASEVLHNVGNILNSINISTTQMTEIISDSRVGALEKVTQMLNEHRDDLATFLTQDAKGQHIPVFLTEASRLMKEEEDRMVKMLDELAKNVRNIKDTISMQQSYAKVSGVEEHTSLIDVIDNAVQINRVGLDRHGVRLVCEFEELPAVQINRQKVLQILVNLINNAKYAVGHSNQDDKVMRIKLCKQGDDRVCIQVADNGLGIDPRHRSKLFQHGFTTKKDGHGFGLHSSALAAEEMGGSLSAHSDGLGKGATFTLELPLNQIEATTCKTTAI
jgi:signal transduction histidine kinase